MASLSTNEIKVGMKVEVEKDPYLIISNEFVKPGKGQAFNRIKMKNMITGRVVERTYKSGEKLDLADIEERPAGSDVGEPGEEDHSTSGDAGHLAKAALEIAPVVDGEDAQGGVDAGVLEGQGLGRPLQTSGRPGRALPDHHLGGLDGDHRSIARLVGAGPRSNVSNTRCISQGGIDGRSDARIGLAIARVAAADGVVEGHGGCRV